MVWQRVESRQGRRAAMTLTGIQAGVTTMRAITSMIDRTIEALTVLDTERLEAVERDASALFASAGQRPAIAQDAAQQQQDLSEVAARQRLLGHLLANTEMNLSVLRGLHRRRRTGDEPWAV